MIEEERRYMTGIFIVDNSVVMSWCFESDGNTIEGSEYNTIKAKPGGGRGTPYRKNNLKTQIWEV
jgi:hypothetical protein